MSLRSRENGETFHPGVGPKFEATLLHVDQPRLRERCEAAPHFVVWDVGLGAAANALAVIEALGSCETPVEIHSFDQTTGPLEFALEHAGELGYLAGKEEILRQMIARGFAQVNARMSWTLHRGDFSKEIGRLGAPSPHAILYDPYSAAKNPEMWTFSHFASLSRALDPARPCLLTNYTRSTSMRVALLLAGFYVGVGKSIGMKAETTIASNCLELLESPLRADWLGRVKRSRNAAPLRSNAYTLSSISDDDFEVLRSHPQFQL
jgi:hypothetical protein